jgi:arylsulfatase A-like enzyme
MKRPALLAALSLLLLLLVAADRTGLIERLLLGPSKARVIRLLTLPPAKIELRSPLWDYRARFDPPWKLSHPMPGVAEYAWEGDLDFDREAPGLEVTSGQAKLPFVGGDVFPEGVAAGYRTRLGRVGHHIDSISLPAYKDDRLVFPVPIPFASATFVFESRRESVKRPRLVLSIGKVWSSTMEISTPQWVTYRVTPKGIAPGTHALEFDGTHADIPAFFLRNFRVTESTSLVVRQESDAPAPYLTYHPEDPMEHLFSGGAHSSVGETVSSPWEIYDEDIRWVRPLNIDGLVRTGLFLPTPASWGAEIDAEPGSAIHFFPAIRNLDGTVHRGRVRLRLVLEHQGVEETLWSFQASPEALKLDWEQGITVPLPAELSGSAKIRFEAEAPDSSKEVVPVYIGDPMLIPAQPAKAGTGRFRKPSSPNIVLISIDTLRADALSCLGYSRKTSPWMEQFFGAGGVRFTQASAPCTWTLPSHAGLFLSQFVSRHGVGTEDARIPASVSTLAEHFADRGYETAAFVDGGFVDANYGFYQGFEQYEQKGGRFAWILPRCEQWLAGRNKEVPLFLFLHTYDVHAPYRAPEPYRHQFLSSNIKAPTEEHLIIPEPPVLQSANRDAESGRPSLDPRYAPYWRALYDAGVLYTDDLLKGFFERLSANGLMDEPLVVLISDHGESFYEHRSWAHGWNVYEELVHVPILIRFPGKKYAGVIRGERVSLIDVAPTLYDFLGWKAPEEWQGRSLLPLIRGESQTEPRRVFTELTRPPFVFSAVYLQNRKFIETRREIRKNPGNQKEIYNLEADPGETCNLAVAPVQGASEEFDRANAAFQIMKNLRHGEGMLERVELNPEDVVELQRQGYLR